MRPSEDERFNVELLKLLVQVAWGDGRLDDRERHAVEGLGRSWLVPEPELQTLLEQLKAGRGLPAPNLGLLREQPDAAMEAVRALVAVDSRLADSEQTLIQEIKDLLRGS